MITTKCEPLTARRRFQLREYVNIGIASAVFIPLMFILPFFFSQILATLIAFAVAAILVFVVLDKRVYSITCPECNGYIMTNTPWLCGSVNCGNKTNFDVDNFPIINCCANCGVEQKAFECPHCKKPIYLTEEHLSNIYATFIKQQVVEPTSPKELSEKDIHESELKLRKARIELELKSIEDKLKPVKLKSKAESLRSSVEEDNDAVLAREVKRLKAEADIEYADNPVERDKQYKRIEAKARNLID